MGAGGFVLEGARGFVRGGHISVRVAERRFFGEAGLSRAAGAGERDEAGCAQGGADALDLPGAADEGGQPAADAGGGGGALGEWGRGGRRGGACGLAQEFRVEGTEFVAGVGAEVFGEGAAEVLVRGEGVGGPAVRAQGTEQKAVEAFVVRVGRGQPAQLGYERGGAPRAQVGLDPAAYGGVPQVLRVAGLRRRLGQVGERGAAPEPECATQDFRGLRVGVRVERGGALAEQVLEPVQVDVTPLRHEPVAARPRGERLVPEGFAQPPDERLQRGGGIPGWLAAPHLVHEGARGHLTAGAQRECGEQRAQPGTAERHGRAVGGVGLGGTEDAVLHLAIVHEGWGWERMFGAVWRGVPGNGVRAGRPPPTRGAPLHPFFRVHPPAPGHPPTSVDNSGRKIIVPLVRVRRCAASSVRRGHVLMLRAPGRLEAAPDLPGGSCARRPSAVTGPTSGAPSAGELSRSSSAGSPGLR